MSDDSRSSRQIQVLKDLGLSRAESEVYLACLQLAAGGSGLLSSYRVAQEMGRDPANVGKIVNTLVHLQAVRVVQEKPRLFVPVAPAEFADRLLGRLRRRGAEAATLLEDLAPPAAEGVVLALADRDQVLARARALISGAAAELLVAGSPEILRELGSELELVAARPQCRVRATGPQAFMAGPLRVFPFPSAGRVGQEPEEAWLLLSVDAAHWLVAVIPHDKSTGSGPCGWWAAASPVARVWAEFMENCSREDATIRSDGPVAPGPAPVRPATSADTPPAAPLTDAPGFVPGGLAGPVPPPPVSPAAPAPERHVRPIPAEAAEQAGFSFLFKHERGRGDEPR